MTTRTPAAVRWHARSLALVGGLLAGAVLVAGCVGDPAPRGRSGPSPAAGALATIVGPTAPVTPTPGTPSPPVPTPTAAQVAALDAASPTGVDVAAENTLPGDPNLALTRTGATGAIEGYTNTVAVLPGRSFTLYASTTAASFVVQAFRLGWYGGAGARLVWTSAAVGGTVQPPPSITPVTHMVSADWSPTLTISTVGWPAGSYVLRLDASNGDQRYVPITVRSPSCAGALVVLNAVTTWQAYNTWGGYSLYTGPTGRGYVVSFDRPYDKTGAGHLLDYEHPLIEVAESTGLPLCYETSIQLQTDPGILAGARGVLSLGHDEYWSATMRQAVRTAIDAGTNVAFFGANAIYRKIRLNPSRLGPDRQEVNYRVAALDPLAATDPAAATVNWPDPPVSRNESSITGQQYGCFSPRLHPMSVVDPNGWVWAGTGVRAGTVLPALVGPESDRLNPGSVPTPRPIQVFGSSTFRCGSPLIGRPTWSDLTYYTTPSGAGVIDVGTMNWACSLQSYCTGIPDPAFVSPITRTVTTTILRVFAAGPAGRTHPAVESPPATAP